MGAGQFAIEAARQRHHHQAVALGKLVPAAAVQLSVRIAVGAVEIEHHRHRFFPS